MKKTNNFEDLLEKLEEALNNILDENPEKRAVNINISVNIIPFLAGNPGGILVTQKEKIPVDILETEKKIHVVVGISGLDLKDIRLTCTGKSLEITSDNPEKSLNELIELPARVNRTGVRTTYNNGILEIVFNKTKNAKKLR